MHAVTWAQSPATVNLGLAGDFAVLSGAAITDTAGITTIDGNVGASPITGAAIGLIAGQVNGTIYSVDAAGPVGSVIDPGLLNTAKLNLTTAYNDAAGRALPTLVVGGTLGGLTLPPGLYKDDGAPASLSLTGTLTLDALGDPSAVWIFQSESTLNAEVDSIVVLANGAEACNVFWAIGSSATLKTRAIFKGVIMADQSIAMQSGASLEGRALALIGGVTFDDNTVGLSSCGAFTLDIPTNTTASCDNIPAAPTVTLTEACSTQTAVAVMTETIIPGSCPNSYTISRVWNALNSCGDSISSTQLISVADTTAPTILNCAAPVTVECASDIPPPNTNAVSATDNCGTVTISHQGDSSLTNACGGSITRTYRATDACGNFSECTQIITVDDTINPTILNCAPPVTVQCVTDIPPPDTNAVSASDNCGAVTISHQGDTTLTNLCGGSITRTYRATDACGNFAECTQIITVDDTIPPVITCPPDTIVVLADANCLGIVPDLRALVQISDNCGTAGLIVTQDPPGGTLFSLQTSVVLTVTGPCGNSGQCIVNLVSPCVPGIIPLFTVEKLMTNIYLEAGTTNQRPPSIGEAMSFVITIVNTGTIELVTVPVIDTYDPTHLQYVNANPPSIDNVNDGFIHWTNVGPLLPGASTSIVVNFIALCASPGTNNALVSPTTPPQSEPALPVLTTEQYEIMSGPLQGNVWIDLDGNGITNENLAVQGLNGVTILLYEIIPGATNLVDQTVTITTNGERGVYMFTGLPLGEYRVNVEMSTVPSTVNINTTPIQLLSDSALCGDYSDANFGFMPGVPTAVDLIDFSARADGEQVNLTWQTLSEWQNAGFNLFRSTSPDGMRTRINSDLVPGSADGSGRNYAFSDPAPLSQGDYYYWLEDVEYDGSIRTNGPARVHVGEVLPGATLIGTTSIDMPGIYMITADTFRRSGIQPASVDPARIRIYVAQVEVASFVSAVSATFSDWDYILFYVNEGAQVGVGYAEGEPLRMDYRYVFVEFGEGEVWTGDLAADADAIQVAIHPEYLRYLITGFHDSTIWLLDITNPLLPTLLIGADLVSVNNETGLYFSDLSINNGIIYAVGDQAVIRIESITP